MKRTVPITVWTTPATSLLVCVSVVKQGILGNNVISLVLLVQMKSANSNLENVWINVWMATGILDVKVTVQLTAMKTSVINTLVTVMPVHMVNMVNIASSLVLETAWVPVINLKVPVTSVSVGFMESTARRTALWNVLENAWEMVPAVNQVQVRGKISPVCHKLKIYSFY